MIGNRTAKPQDNGFAINFGAHNGSVSAATGRHSARMLARATAGRRRMSGTWRVLVVDNNRREPDELQKVLGRLGHEVTCVHTGAHALEAYRDADVVLLDLELTDLDGLEVCRAIRTACDVPLIVRTARESELDCVLAFHAGADDYVVTPYGCRELVARMEAVMRRARPPEKASSVIERGPLRIDTGSREVRLEDRKIPMSRKEFDLLCLLASNPDSLVARETIMREVWDNSWSRRTVDTHVSSIRNKLGANSWIVTVRGVGFRIGQA